MDPIDEQIVTLKERTSALKEKVIGLEDEGRLDISRFKELWVRLDYIKETVDKFTAGTQERVRMLETEVGTLRSKMLNNHRVANSRLWDSWKGLVGWIAGIATTLFGIWVAKQFS